ncbi:MAG: hypothetical protein M1835_002777 [Candelina submexicana]|nr:MAG: hypothetical protein M1835_002777 [Candelina submexicana]
MDSAIKDDRPPPKDLSHHWSRTTKNRNTSNIKDFYKYFSIPGIANLAGGMPHASYFPYDTLEAAVALPDRFVPTPNHPVDPPTSALAATSLSETPTASRMLVPKASKATDMLLKIDLTSALQYGTAQGYPPLHSFLGQFTRENLHPNVPYSRGPEIILTCGNTDGFAKAIEALSNEWSEEKDWIREKEGMLVEEYAYMNAVQAARPRGLNIVPVGMDEEGMRASGKDGLEDVLVNWNMNRGKRPHLLYTVTIGQNPTGGVLSVQRRKDIYALCRKYDILIIEDDPYWYLQYPSAAAANHARGDSSSFAATIPSPPNLEVLSSGFPFLDSLVPSFLSVDTEGRVIRLDTFSKTIAPGCRLGWITAQPALIERILRITETSTQQPSGFVQAMVAELIMGPQSPSDGARGGGKDGKGWSVAGWVRWLEGLRGEYERRMGTMCSILEEGRYLVDDNSQRPRPNSSPSNQPTGKEDWTLLSRGPKMYDFTWPMGGMFVWISLNLSTHPLAPKVAASKLARALWVHLTTKPYLVLVTPGTVFAPTPEIAQDRAWRFFRVCFAAVGVEEVERSSRAFVQGVNDFWRMEGEMGDQIVDLISGKELEDSERCGVM